MKPVIFLLPCLVVAFQAAAQKPIHQLISVEKKFATTSKEQSTKKAFLSFVDSNCIGFRNGEQLNVFKEWTNRKEDSSKLTWEPDFAIISSSGEMGVTAGPWEYRPRSLQDTPVARGNFTTVWMKKSNGEWKAMMDMGISYRDKIEKSSSIKKIVLTDNTIADSSTLLDDIDKNFIEAFRKDHSKTIENAVENDSWISINGFTPFTGAKAIKECLNNLSGNIEFTPVNSFTSNNRDLFVAYGTVIVNDKKQSYMRVWKRDNTKWKLIAMVIS
jgi:hypothetical protein